MKRAVVVGVLLALPVLAETPAPAAQGQRRAQLPAGYVEVDGIAAVVGDQIIGMGELRRAEGGTRAITSCGSARTPRVTASTKGARYCAKSVGWFSMAAVRHSVCAAGRWWGCL